MLVKILKPFHHSADGITSRLLRPSEDPDHREEVSDDVCAGLSGEGYIDGAEHGLPLLSEKRRADLIERILATGRAEFALLSDADLIAAVARYEAHAAARAAEGDVEDAEAEDEDDTLLGSSLQQAHVQLGDVTVLLGGLCVAAAKMSNHDTASWNALPADEREALLKKAIDELAADPARLAAEVDPSTIVPKQDPEDKTDADPQADPAAAKEPSTGEAGPGEEPPAIAAVAEPAAVIEAAAAARKAPAKPKAKRSRKAPAKA